MTKDKQEKNKGGRPKADLNPEMIYKLAQSLLPVETIASILGVSRETLYARYSDSLHKGRDNRKYSLVQAMWHKALEDKDTKMQIWLSKQHLGYKDSLPEEATQVVFNVYTNEVPK